MHIVQFALELETELNLLFVIFRVLIVIFFQFKTHLPLVHAFTVKLFAVFLERVLILLEDSFIVRLLGKFLLIITV